jgi:uncharacterized HhH-GPD family protein
MATTSIPWTADEEANELLAADPNALLIGFALDQQVPVQKAFSGPKVLRERLGHLDPARIAALDPEAFAAICAERPAIHRFPRAMAGRIQELCAVLARDFAGDGSRIWSDAVDGPDLVRRLSSLPGFGPMKVGSMTTVVHLHLGVPVPGIEAVLPSDPCLGGVRTSEELAVYQAGKRAAKAARRAASGA